MRSTKAACFPWYHLGHGLRSRQYVTRLNGSAETCRVNESDLRRKRSCYHLSNLYFPVTIPQWRLNLKNRPLSCRVQLYSFNTTEVPNNSLIPAPGTAVRMRGASCKPKLTLRLKIQYRPSHSISQPSYFSHANQIHQHDLWGILNVYITCVISQMFCGRDIHLFW